MPAFAGMTIAAEPVASTNTRGARALGTLGADRYTGASLAVVVVIR